MGFLRRMLHRATLVRQQVCILLCRSTSERSAQNALRQGRRLATFLCVGELCHAYKRKRRRSAKNRRKKFSPLYISVHATDEQLRKTLLGNSKARPIMPLLKTFAENGIYMFTQIVMCPNLNDGKQLQKLDRPFLFVPLCKKCCGGACRTYKTSQLSVQYHACR